MAEPPGDPSGVSIVRTGRGAWRLEVEQRLTRGRAEVFAFFAEAGNLDRITPPWLGFRIVTPLPVEMRSGAIIDYEIRLHGVPLGWRTEITAWDPPRAFVDEQRRGPYRSWVHRHEFAESGAETVVRDRVDYHVRGGGLVHRIFVRRDLEAIFRYRRSAIEGILGDGAP